jgi:hypothetical protein
MAAAYNKYRKYSWISDEENLYSVDQASNSGWTVLEVGKVKSSEVLSRKAFSGNDHQKNKRKSLRKSCGKKTDCLTVDPP